MNHFDKMKDSPNLQYWDVNNLYGWVLTRKLPVNDFKWVKDISKFNEKFLKSQNDKSDDGGYFLEADVQYPKNLHNSHNDLPFLE